jgi:LysM repeat protein
MQGVRGFTNALVVALISTGLMIGALSISLVEFVPQAAPTGTNILLPSPVHLTATSTLIPTLTPTVGLESPTSSFTPTFINTNTPPASCQPPFGWVQIVIQVGETLETIAARYRISKDELRRANCLLSDNLVAGTILYTPPSMTSTPVVCNQGAAGWVKTYIVKPGDTFYAIASNHYTTAGLLKSVNCRISDLIHPGETLWVPNVATRTPYPTPLPGSTVTPYPTEPLTETALPYTATAIPSNTPLPNTSTPIPTVPTTTPEPTLTPSPTAFPTQ